MTSDDPSLKLRNFASDYYTPNNFLRLLNIPSNLTNPEELTALIRNWPVAGNIATDSKTTDAWKAYLDSCFTDSMVDPLRLLMKVTKNFLKMTERHDFKWNTFTLYEKDSPEATVLIVKTLSLLYEESSGGLFGDSIDKFRNQDYIVLFAILRPFYEGGILIESMPEPTTQFVLPGATTSDLSSRRLVAQTVTTAGRPVATGDVSGRRPVAQAVATTDTSSRRSVAQTVATGKVMFASIWVYSDTSSENKLYNERLKDISQKYTQPEYYLDLIVISHKKESRKFMTNLDLIKADFQFLTTFTYDQLITDVTQHCLAASSIEKIPQTELNDLKATDFKHLPILLRTDIISKIYGLGDDSVAKATLFNPIKAFGTRSTLLSPESLVYSRVRS